MHEFGIFGIRIRLSSDVIIFHHTYWYFDMVRDFIQTRMKSILGVRSCEIDILKLHNWEEGSYFDHC